MTEKSGWQPGKGFLAGARARAAEVRGGITTSDEVGFPEEAPDLVDLDSRVPKKPSRRAGIKRQIETLPSDVLRTLETGKDQALADFKQAHPRFTAQLEGFISGKASLPKNFKGWLEDEVEKIGEAHERFKNQTPDWVYQGKWGKAAMNYWKFGRTAAPLLGGPAAFLAVGAWTVESSVRLGKTIFLHYEDFPQYKREFLFGVSGGTVAFAVSQVAAAGIGMAAGRLVPGGEGVVRLVSYGARRLAVPYINQIALAQVFGHIGEWNIGKRIKAETSFNLKGEQAEREQISAAQSWFNAGMIAATVGSIGLGTFVKPVLGNLVTQIKEAGLPAHAPVETPTEEVPTRTLLATHTPGLGIRETATPTETPTSISTPNPTPEPTHTPKPEPTPTVKPWEIGEIPNEAQIAQADDLGSGDINFDGTPDGHWLDFDHDGRADVLINSNREPIAWVQDFDLNGDGVLDRAIAVDFDNDGKPDSLYSPEDLGLGPEAHRVMGRASPIKHERNEPPLPRAIDLDGDGRFDSPEDLVRTGDDWYVDLDGDGIRDQLESVDFRFNDSLGRWEIESVQDLQGRVYTFNLDQGWVQSEEGTPSGRTEKEELTDEERLNSRYGRLILGPKGGVWGLVQEELYSRHPDWTGDQIADEAYKVMQMIKPQIPGELPTHQGAPVVYSGENLGTFLERAGIREIDLDQLLGSQR